VSKCGAYGVNIDWYCISRG